MNSCRVPWRGVAAPWAFAVAGTVALAPLAAGHYKPTATRGTFAAGAVRIVRAVNPAARPARLPSPHSGSGRPLQSAQCVAEQTGYRFGMQRAVAVTRVDTQFATDADPIFMVSMGGPAALTSGWMSLAKKLGVADF